MIGAHRVENGQASGCERLVYGLKDEKLVVPLEICIDDSSGQVAGFDGAATNLGVIQQDYVPGPSFPNGSGSPLVLIDPDPDQDVLATAPAACDGRAANVGAGERVALYCLDLSVADPGPHIITSAMKVTGTVTATGVQRDTACGSYEAVEIHMSTPLVAARRGARVVVTGGAHDGTLLGVLVESSGNQGWVLPAHLI